MCLASPPTGSIGPWRVQSCQILTSLTATLGVQGLSRGQAGFAPSWLSSQSPEGDFLPCICAHTGPEEEAVAGTLLGQPLLLWPGLAGRAVCVLFPSLPTLGAPHLNPHSQAFSQPGITSSSYPRSGGPERTNRFGDPMQPFNSKQSPPPTASSHTHSGKGRQGLGSNKTQTRAKIYI